jgi:hypothetical protein
MEERYRPSSFGPQFEKQVAIFGGMLVETFFI